MENVFAALDHGGGGVDHDMETSIGTGYSCGAAYDATTATATATVSLNLMGVSQPQSLTLIAALAGCGCKSGSHPSERGALAQS